MEVLPTAKAAALLGVNVQRFHRLVAKYGITPTLKAEGQTGAMFWRRSDVERLADEMRRELAADLARLDAAREAAS
jgi:hypothetical protein